MYDGYDLYPDSSGYGAYLGEFGSAVAMDNPNAYRLAAVGTGVLRKGSKGVMARKLQEQLKFLGYDVGTIDGDFGNKTRAQLKKFQRDVSTRTGIHGVVRPMSIDGVAGPKTWEALSSAVKAKQIMEPTWTAEERAEFARLNTPSAPTGPFDGSGASPAVQRSWGAGKAKPTLGEAMQNIGRQGQVLAPLAAPPPPAMTPEQRKQRLAQVPIWNKADGVDYAVAAGSGFVTGILTGALGRRIDIPWYIGALAGLGLGSGLGLAASVKLREDGN